MLAKKVMMERKFVRHPENIKMDVKRLNIKDDSQVNTSDCHGLIFNSEQIIPVNEQLEINFSVDELKFIGKARVVGCQKQSSGFDIYIEFLQCTDPFQVKMALQVCQIKDFLESKCKNMDKEEAALKWIKMNAANF